MSINKHQPHILILPEDDANRQLANGFVLGVNSRQIQILPIARGWCHVCEVFESDHISAMNKYPCRFMILLIDFDDHFMSRFPHVQEKIPMALRPRVFILGVRSEPEALKRETSRSYEVIGQQMASDCRNGVCTIWGHDLLRHNDDELVRLRQSGCPILDASVA